MCEGAEPAWLHRTVVVLLHTSRLASRPGFQPDACLLCVVPRAHVMQASKDTVREADKLKAAAARALLARYGACILCVCSPCGLIP